VNPSPTPNPGFRRIGIVGLGLMGGSLALALRRLEEPPFLAAFSLDRDELAQAQAAGIIDHAAPDPAAAVQDADLVVYATPIAATLELLHAHRGLWPAHAILTDLGSVKRPIMRRAAQLGLGTRFVGGHPMTGDHRTGLAAARADLYELARVWLVPAESPAHAHDRPPNPGHDPLARLAALWRALGAQPAPIDADRHDLLVAWTSHLPQLAASALGATLQRAGIDPTDLGPGGRDTTRLAAASPDLWTDILLHNADLLARPLAELRATLDQLADALARHDPHTLHQLLERARHWRQGG